MKVQEAIKDIQFLARRYEDLKEVKFSVLQESLDAAIQSLEIQEKLKQWIENYKNPEFEDVMITRDGLIDILEEFRLECETDARNPI